MHILMLSDFETQGGAAVAASRLAEALSAAGHTITRVIHVADGGEHGWRTRVLTPRRLWPRRALRLVPLPVRRRVTELNLRRLLSALRPDVVNVHNLHGAGDYGWSVGLLRAAAACCPVVWTLHDMWSFTGRCAYSYDCRKFTAGCDSACPTPNEYPALDPRHIARAWHGRRRLLAEVPQAVAVAPSRWLAQEARSGLWCHHRVERIPYGLPLHVYQPVNRELSRQALAINSSGPILLIAAQSLSERRKGGDLLAEALRRVSRRPLTLLTLGAGRLNLDADGVTVCNLGFVDHERTRVLAYSAADVFVHPAPVDNLPNVVMEAIACGTPVVGLPTGGVSDMVRPSISGWLADEVSAAALARAIQSAVGDLESGVDLRESCRGLAESEYRPELQAERYLALFDGLRSASTGPCPSVSTPN